MAFNEQTETELMTVCEAGADAYISQRRKERVSRRINEGMIGALFATAIYGLFDGYRNFDYRMALAPFVAGAAYAIVGRRNAGNQDADTRMAFEQVCSNIREDESDA